MTQHISNKPAKVVRLKDLIPFALAGLRTTPVLFLGFQLLHSIRPLNTLCRVADGLIFVLICGGETAVWRYNQKLGIGLKKEAVYSQA